MPLSMRGEGVDDEAEVHACAGKKTRTNHIDSIDMLRGYSALLVCLFHITAAGQLIENPTFGTFASWGGADGINLFFIVSGVVIPFALFNGGYGLRAFPRFVAKRIIRLEPPYIASILVAIALWLRFQYSADAPLDLVPTTAALHLGYLIDFARYFGAAVEWYVPIFWTLAYELQYYVCVSLLSPLIISPVASVRIAAVASLIVAKYVLMPLCAPLFVASAEYFAFGIVLFQRRAGLTSPHEFACLAFLLVVAMAIGNWRFAIYGPLFAVLLLARDINWTLGRFMGLISYSLYLTHDTFGGWLRGALVVKLHLGTQLAVILRKHRLRDTILFSDRAAKPRSIQAHNISQNDAAYCANQ